MTPVPGDITQQAPERSARGVPPYGLLHAIRTPDLPGSRFIAMVKQPPFGMMILILNGFRYHLPPAGLWASGGSSRYGSGMTIVSGAGVVVTGGGGGIGRAIARRLAADGARVVVNDLDQAAAQTVANEMGGLPAPGDAGTEQGVDELIKAATEFLGEIDIYCSNAGTVAGTGPETADDLWQRAWEVNAMSHVRAARLLLPGWLARGAGTFVVTASAAGLLTMLGAAPYSVTKHAAVGFAEWLAATYAHRGLTVHCVCPQGVRTQMLANSGRAGEIVLADAAIEPEQVADALAAAMAEGRFLVLPHPEVRDYYVNRATDTDRWLRGMSRLQQRIEGDSVKAWRVTRYGEPEDVLELAAVPRPEPGPGQLLVRVLAAAANFPDVLLCRGNYQVRPPLPFTPGVELCGEVVELGADVTRFSSGTG